MSEPSGSNPRYRPLLPQTLPPARSSPIPPAKKARVKSACDACRQCKTKCSGDHPRCKLCVERGSKCRYTATPAKTRLETLQRKCNDLQTRASPYEQLFQIMKVASEAHARNILARFRSGTDVEALLNHVTDGDLLLQLSVVPESRYRYNFPYIVKMPQSLLAGDNPYLQSVLYEAAAVYSSSGQRDATRESSQNLNRNSGSDTMPYPQDGNCSKDDTMYLKPFHAAEVIDPRLDHVKISHWTNVCDDDLLMRDLFRKWLHCEYQFTAAFQKDLFLEDMVAQRHDFCSSLLVNVVLGYACVCYTRFTKRAEYWNPQTWTYRFIAEAKRLWELEAHEPRLTTIQAGMLFNVFYNLSGLDVVGQAYRIQALNLAHEIRLFKRTLSISSPRIRHGMAYTAWALYNWEALVGFSFMFAPLLIDPPDWELPDPSKEPQWYGEINTQYPLTNRPFPSYFGHVFKARSEFRIIMNEACQAAYSTDSEMTLLKANELFLRLKGWFDSLSGPLSPRFVVLPCHLQLHMYYHHLILTIFKPLLDAETDQKPSPYEIVADATKCLQTLFRLYYLRHGYDAMDLFIVIPLMLAATECVDAITEETPESELETLRSTLILVAMGLYKQRKNHYLAQALFRVIRGRMRTAEVGLFRGIVNIDADEPQEVDTGPAVRSHWPVSVVKKKEDVDSYILKNLVENYAHLNVSAD